MIKQAKFYWETIMGTNLGDIKVIFLRFMHHAFFFFFEQGKRIRAIYLSDSSHQARLPPKTETSFKPSIVTFVGGVLAHGRCSLYFSLLGENK
jgi:hypothetical protein